MSQSIDPRQCQPLVCIIARWSKRNTYWYSLFKYSRNRWHEARPQIIYDIIFGQNMIFRYSRFSYSPEMRVQSTEVKMKWPPTPRDFSFNLWNSQKKIPYTLLIIRTSKYLKKSTFTSACRRRLLPFSNCV